MPSDMTYGEWKEKQNSIDLMSSSFRPEFSKNEIIENIGIARIKIKKIENSEFDLYVDEEYAEKRNKAIRNTEKIMKKIKESLDIETFSIGKVVITDFTKIDENYKNAIGMYDNINDTIYISVKYDTNEKILSFLNKNRHLFANNNSIMSPLLHEVGHKFYQKTIKKLAKREKIGYNEAKDRIDNKIFNKIKELNINESYDFVSKNISQYADRFYHKHKYTEVIAESLTVYDNNRVANELIKELLKEQ